MGTDTNANEAPIDMYAMSDADFLSADPSQFGYLSEPSQEETQEPSAPVVASGEDLGEDVHTEQDSAEVAEDGTEEESDDTAEVTEDSPEEEESEETDEGVESAEEVTEEAPEIPTELLDLKKILEPFKANGMDMQVTSADEAIQLMQMGANYGKKMAALKPNLQILKTLEKYGLNDQGRLNHLIELSQGNPDAIAKLVQDSKIDPMDLSDKGAEYTPKNHAVSHEEVELGEAIKLIQETPHGTDTLTTLQGWDTASKEVLGTNPQQLQLLNAHKGDGIFDKVNLEVARQKTLGGLMGLSDFQAYHVVGAQMEKQGLFGNAPTPATEDTAPMTDTAKTKVKKGVRSKKRAASPATDKASANPSVADFDIMSMSDEDFRKLPMDKFL